MQSERVKYYYCFQCKKTVQIKHQDLICPDCGSDFLQEAKGAENEEQESQGIPLDEFLTILPHIFPNRPGLPRFIEEIKNRSQVSPRGLRLLLKNLVQYLNEIPSQINENEDSVSKEVVITGTNELGDCKICFSSFSENEEKLVLGCSHEYHVGCLDPWLKISSSCPVCKKRVG